MSYPSTKDGLDVDLVVRIRVARTGERLAADAIDAAEDFLRGFLVSAESIDSYEFVMAASRERLPDPV